ncbi:MAG: hypothetical protein HXX16_18270 [Bacteroidales bacterium]|nr:hypothetical protein [Bacteroidales bacterium]
MAQFVAFDQNVEVNKITIMSVVNSMEKGKETRIGILEKNGINVEKKEWYPQQNWLNAFKEIASTLGDMNLFLIGKAIIDSAKFPPINNLEEALRSLDIAYHMNHRLNGKVMFDSQTGNKMEGIGHYKLKEYNAAGKRAIMVCDNPYPSKFDEGIITQLVRKFKETASTESIKLDLTKETRIKGGHSCTYNIAW